MPTQTSLSYDRESARSADTHNAKAEPMLHSRMTLTSRQKALRDSLGTLEALSYVTPGCRTVSFSSWGRFTALPTEVTPSGQLKASDICNDRGMTPSFDPPVSERCYLGADQPPLDPRHTNALPALDNHRRYTGSATSWETGIEKGEEGNRSQPLRFSKQPPKRTNTNSQITRSFEMSQFEESKSKTLVETLGLVGVTCQELPSAFDSDEEDD